MLEKYVENSEEIYELLDTLWEKYGCIPMIDREEERMMEYIKKEKERELVNLKELSPQERSAQTIKWLEEDEEEERRYAEEDKEDEENDGDNYGAFRGEYMNMLTDGLYVIESLFVARKTLLCVMEYYNSYVKTLQCILENKELEAVLRCVHSVLCGPLGLKDDTCIKYGSILCVLDTKVIVDGQERKVLDIVMERLKGVDLSSLVELHKMCLDTIGCDPLMLLSEFQKAKYSLKASVDDVKRMRKNGERNAIMHVCEVMKERLEETRECRFGASKNGYDFGISVTGLAEVNGKYGEDEVAKGCAVETVISNTIKIIRALGVDVKYFKWR